MSEKMCQYLILRFVPDIVRGEFLNFGIFLFDPKEQRIEGRFLENFRRVKRLYPSADIGLLASLEDQFDRMRVDNAAELRTYVEHLQTFSNVVQVSEPKIVLTADFDGELDRLYDIYVREPKYSPRLAASIERSRAWLRSLMNRAFRRVGIFDILERRVPVEEFTHKGDPLRIDFSHRAGREWIFVHAVSLSGRPEQAKILAYTVERIAAKTAAAGIRLDAYAVVEEVSEGQDSTVEFSRRALLEQQIELVATGSLEAFANGLRDRVIRPHSG